MATARTGPALNQGVVVYQGAPVTYLVPVSDPDGTRPDLTGATATWWAGAVPAGRPLAPQFSVADTPESFSKALVVQADGVGGFRIVLAIAPADLAGFSPTELYQHEIWVTEVGKAPYPVTIGPLDIRGTVKGAAAS